MVQRNPPPFLAVPGFCNNCLARLVLSLEKERDVVKALVVKHIVGKNHRTYVIDDESCFFQDLSFTA
jgi:hypothetical protein